MKKTSWTEEAMLKDCYQHYIAELPEALRPFAEMHVAGATDLEIANHMHCVERTVERKRAGSPHRKTGGRFAQRIVR